MTAYSLKKWYFDVDTDGDKVLGYLADLHLLGTESCRLSIAKVHADGSAPRAAIRTIALLVGSSPGYAPTNHGAIEFERNRGRIALDVDGLALDLEFVLTDAEPLPILSIQSPRAKGRIEWHPLALRAQASGLVTWDNQTIRIVSAPAYLDYLHSTVFPRLAPARRLLWGHLYRDTLALTYVVLESQNADEHWSTLILSEEGRVTAMPVKLSFKACPTAGDRLRPLAYELSGETETCTVTVWLEPIQATLETQFIDDDVSVGWIGRRILAWLALHPHATKYFAQAHVRIERDSELLEITDVPVFSEYVEFSR